VVQGHRARRLHYDFHLELDGGWSVGPTVLPYLTRRALKMHRYPNGAQAKGFWHKEVPAHAPDWLPRWTNPEADPDETQTYLVVDEPAALVWAANFGALEWHAWTYRVDRPTYALIDLDPGAVTSWDDLLVLARLHRTAVEHLGLCARAKLTGRRGIQIWIPIVPGPDFTTARAWVEQLSRTVGAVVPELVSWKWQVADRGGRAAGRVHHPHHRQPHRRTRRPVRRPAPQRQPLSALR